MSETKLHGTLICPHCGHREDLAMPENARVYFHLCAGCGAMLKPLPGDCYVFCSYGTVPCPPKQKAAGCCNERGE